MSGYGGSSCGYLKAQGTDVQHKHFALDVARLAVVLNLILSRSACSSASMSVCCMCVAKTRPTFTAPCMVLQANRSNTSKHGAGLIFAVR
jgi:hypothetical protein